MENRSNALTKAPDCTNTPDADETMLDHRDNLLDIHLAEQRLMGVRNGNEATHALDEVMGEYGLDH